MCENDVCLCPALGQGDAVSADGTEKLLVYRTDELQPLVEHLSSVSASFGLGSRIEAHAVKFVDKDGLRIPDVAGLDAQLAAGPHQGRRLRSSLYAI